MRIVQRMLWLMAFGLPPVLLVVSEHIRIGTTINNCLFAMSIVALFGNYIISMARALQSRDRLYSLLVLNFVRAPLALLGWLVYVFVLAIVDLHVYGFSAEVFD